MAYASYEDYCERYRGRAIRSGEDFDRLAIRANAVLDRLTFGRSKKYSDPEKRLCLACCAVAEKLQETEEREKEVAEERVGDHSVRYCGFSRSADAAELAALAEMYLVGTGLLSRGIPCMHRIP